MHVEKSAHVPILLIPVDVMFGQCYAENHRLFTFTMQKQQVLIINTIPSLNQK